MNNDEKTRLVCKIAPVLRMLYSSEGMATVCFFHDEDPPSPIAIADIPGKLIITEPYADISSEFESYCKVNGFKPQLVNVCGLGCFKITKSSRKGKLAGKIAIVTGAAQGLGKSLAMSLAAEGALVTVADRNIEDALICAREINEAFGKDTAVAIQTDVTDEASVESMIQETVLAFGGLDILVSNAGVLIAGGVSDLSKDDFDFVTNVNYTGYFLCVKYASEIMKLQRKYSTGFMTDIIEINSKSGLEGSSRNSAYAGSKFGGIGLTQSFALELVEYGIKVNAICPGNLLDSPLWTDPERGLFKQYLDSGKVKGAKTINDVKKYYENRVPMGRGCTADDITRAVFYIIEQKYETGQAIPVTGGQLMLN